MLCAPTDVRSIKKHVKVAYALMSQTERHSIRNGHADKAYVGPTGSGYSVFSDGVILCDIVEALHHAKLVGVNRQSTARASHLHNVELALEVCRNNKVCGTCDGRSVLPTCQRIVSRLHSVLMFVLARAISCFACAQRIPLLHLWSGDSIVRGDMSITRALLHQLKAVFHH